MLKHVLLRTGTGLPVAAGIVWGLFAFMSAMIANDFVPPVQEEARELSAFAFPDIDGPLKPKERKPPERLDLATPPPALPRLASAKPAMGLPVIDFGAPDAQLPRSGLLNALDVSPVRMANRIVQPLSPPAFAYPQALASRGVEGDCNIRLDVDAAGRPYNIEAQCSHAGFRREAERAVRRVQFAPKIVDGQPRAQENVIYPVEFRLNRE